MAAQESTRAVWVSFGANIGIAVSKFVAFIITGSSSMLAEAVHSVADSSNQVLLLIGGRQSQREPTPAHPFGYGRAHFLYAFIVSIVLFTLGGAFAVYEGFQKISNPHPIEAPLVAYVVLAVAFILEATALRTVIREAQSFKPKDQSWWQFLRQTKSVNHVVLALEDSAALLGLVFAAIGISLVMLTGNPMWDGIATFMIGLLLIVVAAVLFREVKSLLIGEAVDAETEHRMREVILAIEGVDRLIDLKTLYVGPLELFVAMKITVDEDATARVIADTINQVESSLRREFPAVRLIYVEPDLFRSK